MKNLKRLLSVLIVVAMLVTAMLPASAASSYNYEDEARALYDLGLYAGISKTEYQPDLGSKLTREQGVVLLVRFMGAEDEANALSEAEADTELTFFKDKASISSWAKKSVAYALRKKWVSGFPDGTFKPQGELLGKQFATMYLVAMGYTPDSTIYQSAAFYAANLSTEVGGITLAEASAWNDKVMTRDDAVGFAFGMLSTKNKDGKTLASILVEKGVVTADELTKAGAYGQDLYDAAVAAVEAYEKIDLSTLKTVEDCDKTETTKKAATDAIAKVTADSAKKALQSRVTAKEAAIAAIKDKLQGTSGDQDEIIKAAEEAVVAYEETKDYANAESLKLDAVAAVGQVKDEAKKKDLMDRITARSADISAIVAATAAVDEYVKAPYGTKAEIDVAEALEKTATEKIALIKNDETVKSDLTKKVADRKALVDAKKAEIVPAEVTVTANNLKTLTLTFSKPMNIGTTLSTSNIRLINTANNKDILYGTSSIEKDKETGFSLSEDKKTLTLVYSDTNGVAQSTSIRVVVSGLKDTNGVTTSYDGTVTVIDQANAQIDVKKIDSYSIQLAASEPLKLGVANGASFYADGLNYPSIKIDGSVVYIKKITYTNATGIIDLELNATLSDGTHVVDISGFRDYAGFLANSITGYQVTTARDVTGPTVINAELFSNNKITITFNEKVADGSVPYSSDGSLPEAVFTVKQLGDTTPKEINIARDGLSNTYFKSVEFKDDKVILTLADAYKLNYGATVLCQVTVNGLYDAHGNKMPTATSPYNVKVQSSSTEMPMFAAPPTILSSDDPGARGLENMVKLTFNVPVDMSNITLYDDKLSQQATSMFDVLHYDPKNPDYKTYVINFYYLTGSMETYLTEGSLNTNYFNDYDGATNTLESRIKKRETYVNQGKAGTSDEERVYYIEGVKDTGIMGATMERTMFTIIPKDTKLPQVRTVQYEKDILGNVTLHVYFTKAIDTTTATSISNYYFGDSSTSINQVLPTSASVTTYTNEKFGQYEVRITIPAGTNLATTIANKMSSGGTYYIAVINVKDTKGNAIAINKPGGLQSPFKFSTAVDPSSGDTEKAFGYASIDTSAKKNDTIEISIGSANRSGDKKYYFATVDKNDFSFKDRITGETLIEPSDIITAVAVVGANDQKYNLILRNGIRIENDGTFKTSDGAYHELYMVVTAGNTKNQFGVPLAIASADSKTAEPVKDGIAPVYKKTVYDVHLLAPSAQIKNQLRPDNNGDQNYIPAFEPLRDSNGNYIPQQDKTLDETGKKTGTNLREQGIFAALTTLIRGYNVILPGGKLGYNATGYIDSTGADNYRRAEQIKNSTDPYRYYYLDQNDLTKIGKLYAVKQKDDNDPVPDPVPVWDYTKPIWDVKDGQKIFVTTDWNSSGKAANPIDSPKYHTPNELVQDSTGKSLGYKTLGELAAKLNSTAKDTTKYTAYVEGYRGDSTITLEFSENIYAYTTTFNKSSTVSPDTNMAGIYWDWTNNTPKNPDTSYEEALEEYNARLLEHYRNGGTDANAPAAPLETDYGIYHNGEASLADALRITIGTSTLKPNVDYTTTIEGNKLVVTLSDSVNVSALALMKDMSNLTVQFDKTKAYYIVDANGSGMDTTGLPTFN